MPLLEFAVLVAGWVAWAVPFFLIRRKGQTASRIDRRARWGIALTAIGYSVLWQGKFWERTAEGWQIALSILFFATASVLSWSATRALGSHWRIDAGLNAEHQLVMSGPYRVVRHPIYTSMLCQFFATGVLVAPSLLLIAGAVLVFAGTEIRVRVEDRLLGERFGDRFQKYQHDVAAYIPFVR